MSNAENQQSADPTVGSNQTPKLRSTEFSHGRTVSPTEAEPSRPDQSVPARGDPGQPRKVNPDRDFDPGFSDGPVYPTETASTNKGYGYPAHEVPPSDIRPTDPAQRGQTQVISPLRDKGPGYEEPLKGTRTVEPDTHEGNEGTLPQGMLATPERPYWDQTRETPTEQPTTHPVIPKAKLNDLIPFNRGRFGGPKVKAGHTIRENPSADDNTE